LGESIAALDFTEQAAEDAEKLMAFESQDDDTTAVKPPSEFTAGTKWRAFKEGAIAFFNSQKGRGQIPLA
jgi:putative NADH-flavin reductase